MLTWQTYDWPTTRSEYEQGDVSEPTPLPASTATVSNGTFGLSLISMVLPVWLFEMTLNPAPSVLWVGGLAEATVANMSARPAVATRVRGEFSALMSDTLDCACGITGLN
jgi:hypothetical protein